MHAQQLRRLPSSPVSGPYQPFALARAARGHQHQGHGNICRGVGDGTRRVGYPNACLSRGINVDVIVPDAEIRQYLAARCVDTSKNVGRKLVAQRWQNAVVIPQSGLHLLHRKRC